MSDPASIQDVGPALHEAIRLAREAGLTESALELEDRSFAAYTTSSEFLGEVGDAIAHFKSVEGERIPPAVLTLLDECLAEIDKVSHKGRAARGLRRAMAVMRKLLVLCVVISVPLEAQVAPVPPPPPPGGTVLILTDRALDGRGNVLRAARIGVRDGKITSLAADSGDMTIDLRRYTVLPGWIDTHVHLDSHWDRTGRIASDAEPPAEAALGIAGNAWDTLMGGFTTVQSVGDPAEKPLRDAIRDRGFPGPRVLTSLAPIHGDPATPLDTLRALVRERKSEGADLIKIFASNSQRVGAKPTLTQAQLAALCGEARALGLRTMVHAYRSQVAAAARAGCNQVEHATYAAREDIEAAVRAGAFIGPQVGLVVQNYLLNKARYLGVGNYTEEGMAIMDRDLPFDFEACRTAISMPGAKVVFSTDATAGAHGRNAEEFIGRVKHCGQTPMAALVSANAVAAEALGMADRLGALVPGYDADIIALDGDPSTDITAVRRVVFVMRGGVVYKWAPGSNAVP